MDTVNWDAAREHIAKASERVGDFQPSTPEEQLRLVEVHAQIGLAMSNYLLAVTLQQIASNLSR